MKKAIFIFILLGIAQASCKKELDQQPISATTTATFYKQPSDFLQGINAVYNSLRGYPDRALFLSEVRSDNIYPSNNDVGRDHDPISDFAPGIAPNVYVEEAWRANYNGIFKANTVLEQIAKSNGDVLVVGPAALATRITAEAKFLRAFFYFDLVKYFGKVPVIDHTVTASEATKIGRSPVADVYALIIDDLKYAIANLPATYGGTYPAYSATDVGRATKFAAEAILARVYMTRSGPTYGIEGPGMGLNEWSLALPLLQDIITNGGFVFNSNYANIFSYANQNPTVNKEAVFDVMYLKGQSPVLGATFPWILAPQNYFNSFPTGNTALNGALGAPSVSNDLVNSYASGDVRKTQSINTTSFTYTGITDSHPFFKKYLDITQIPTTRFDWGINFMVVRYTDVLLMKAECVLRGAPGTAATDVDAVVNQVRTRAGIGAVPLVGVTLTQLFDERRKEFGDEGLRWFDLQRSGNLLTVMSAFKATEDAALKKMSTITANSIIYPVPQSQTDAVPGLYTQNPGY